MSLGYAERLSFREDLGGRLGDPEVFDNAQEVLQKLEQLTELVRSANKVVAFTGAGISTACGIPDFRGPNGVWTLQRQGLPLPKAKTSFIYAQPSLTHMALLGLMQSGKLKYICSQNVDSLHLRSGVPRSQLAELHGNCFAERCKKCKTEYVRDFEMDTVGFQPTGRPCTKPGCKGQLVDHILDWEDPLPPAELKATEQHASAADVSICLGTSLQIIPAANLPLRTVKSGGSLAIINLQATPKDKKATVVLHAKADQVMATLMQRLCVPIPTYVRTDRLQLSHQATAAADVSNTSQDVEQQQQQSPAPDGSSSSSSWSFQFTISSAHGEQCPLPMVAAAHISFYDQAAVTARKQAAGAAAAGSTTPAGGLPPSAAAAAAAAGVDSAAAAAAAAPDVQVDVVGLPEVLVSQELSGPLPWRVERAVGPDSLQEVAVVVRLQLVEAADQDKRAHQVCYSIKRPAAPRASTSQGRGTRGAAAKQRRQQQLPDGCEEVGFITQVRDYSSEQQDLVAALLQAAGSTQAVEQQQTHTPAAATSPAAVPVAAPAGEAKVSQGAAGGSSEDMQCAVKVAADSSGMEVVVVEEAKLEVGSDSRPHKRSKQCVGAG